MSIDISTIARDVVRSVIGVGRGTGTVVADGVVLTPVHNLRSTDAGAAVTLHLAEGRRAEGRVLAASDDWDLAAVAVDVPDLRPLARTAQPPTIGDAVAAVAAPDGTPRVTAGAIAAVGTRLHTRTGSPVDGLLEHTAPLPRGASGGPVLDAAGALVGIALNRLEGGLYQAVGVTGAAGAAIDQLVAGHVPATRRLGVAVTPSRKARWLREAVGLTPLDGVLVADADPDGPAAAAGLGRGDTITAVGDTPVRRPDDLLLALRTSGASAELTVVRGAEGPRTVVVDLGTA